MSGIASSSPIADADPAADPAVAAVTRAIALLRVVGRLARTAFALGRTAKCTADKARSEGARPYEAVPRLRGALEVVHQALLVADALRRRLRTPAVRLALQAKRRAAAEAEAAAAEQAGEQADAPRPAYRRRLRWRVGADMSDPMARIVERRHHPEAQAAIRRMIASMSDAEVLGYIGNYLLTAAALLDDFETTEQIERVIAQAMRLFDAEDAEQVLPRVRGALGPEERAAAEAAAAADAAAWRADCAAQAAADAASAEQPEAAGTPDATDAPDATGRGPPIA